MRIAGNPRLTPWAAHSVPPVAATQLVRGPRFFQLGVKRDLGVQKLGNRAATLGVVGSLAKCVGRSSGNARGGLQMDLGYGKAGLQLLQGDCRLGSDTLRLQTGIAQL